VGSRDWELRLGRARRACCCCSGAVFVVGCAGGGEEAVVGGLIGDDGREMFVVFADAVVSDWTLFGGVEGRE